jgi:hypothetical protein
LSGSGRVRIGAHRPLTVGIAANLVAEGPAGGTCQGQAAVFGRLFAALVWPCVRVAETAGCAEGAPACRFEIAPARAGPADNRFALARPRRSGGGRQDRSAPGLPGWVNSMRQVQFTLVRLKTV